MNVYLDTVGCRLNQSEIESFSRQFRLAGHTIVSSPGLADLVIVNTCTVTAEAASDSRQKIRQAYRAGASQVTVTGCWATLDPSAAIALPGVTRVVPNPDKARLVPILLDLPIETFDLEFIERQPIPGARQRTRAFIKAQDGCDNRCTFCITALARGTARSLPTSDVLRDVRAALAGGAQEVVLTGVHLGSWGAEFPPSQNLRFLVQSILQEMDVPRLRLSSLEPWDIDEHFFELWQDERLCRHLHLPLQSGCAATLRRMARKVTPTAYADLLATARRHIPDIAITTDVIAGFPGESEAEFAESLAFIQSMQFAGGHVFTYSPRPGTAAERLPAQVPAPLRKSRNALLRQVFAQTALAYQQRFVGQNLSVLWESATPLAPQDWEMAGLTDNYLRVTAHAPINLWNRITPVHIQQTNPTGLSAILCEHPSPNKI